MPHAQRASQGDGQGGSPHCRPQAPSSTGRAIPSTCCKAACQQSHDTRHLQLRRLLAGAAENHVGLEKLFDITFSKKEFFLKDSEQSQQPIIENNSSMETVEDFLGIIGLLYTHAARSTRDFIEQHSYAINKIEKFFFLLAEGAAKLDEGQKKTVKKCLKSGWYPIFNMAFTYVPDDLDFDAGMAHFLESHLEQIEEVLCEKHKNRAEILKAAFSAHKQGNYILSIPPLLAQAEGICAEKLGISPFSRDKKNHIRLQDKVPPEFFNGFILRYFNPLVLHEDIRKKSAHVHPLQLNRNSILHGSSTEYATRENSLKAISFLSSLSSLLMVLEINKSSQ